MSDKQKYWIFANRPKGYDNDSVWDTNTILKTRRYYFKESERNCSYVQKGDIAIFREYGSGYWGTCKVGKWVDDPEWANKSKKPAGWFEISKIKLWDVPLPQGIIWSELSNQNHRLRIAKATEEDKEKIDLARKIYKNLGYGAPDGEFFILENGIEEAVKKNLTQLRLRPAEDEIYQQCSLDIGIGRTDLICRDKDNNYVVIELKLSATDIAVGQILRYIGYIRENWAEKEKKDVKGIILTHSFDEQLRYAAKEADVKVLRIRIG